MSEKYEFTGMEKYHAIRRNRDDISFDGYKNKIYFNESERSVTIHVSSAYEYDEEEQETYMHREDEKPDIEPYLPFNEKIIRDNGNDYLYRDVFHLSTAGENIPSFKLNEFAGLDVTFPVGEGILDFCDANFDKELPFLQFVQSFIPKDKAGNIPPQFHNKDEIEEYELEKMRFTIETLHPYLYQSIYSSIFPPYIEYLGEKTLLYYAAYIKNIQKEMLRRIEFVFDEEFYPEELSRLKVHERFALYCDIFDIPQAFERNERFGVTIRMDKTTLIGTRLPMSEIISRLQSHIPTNEKSPLEQAYGLEAGRVNLFYHVPHFLSIVYDCSTIHDMLEIEFSKMLEYGIRLHRCKNCGRYFIVKGNYDAEYCDRVREGQTKNCQQTAAQKKYDEKLHGNEAVALFRKYYKRYHARSKVGTIKPDKFKQWNYAACEMRDKCMNGEISTAEFEEWLEGCFRNRKQKI